MNYNDYDSNGNKKKIDLSDMFHNKQKRSILILGMYIIAIAILIIFLRLSFKNTYKEDDKEQIIEEKQEEIEEQKEEKDLDDVDRMFKFIDKKNYNFKFTINDDGVDYISQGKRYNDKYYFTFTNGEQSLTFTGTKGNIKVKNIDGNEMISSFPYVFFNYYDNEILKNIIRNSNNNNGIYEITNEKLYESINLKANEESNKNNINTIELIVKNSNVVGFNINISSAISDFNRKEQSTKIKLEYYDFDLIDDFSTSF